MVLIITTGIAVALVSFLVLLVPIGLTGAGKMLVIITCTIVSLIGILGRSVFSLSQLALFQLVLALLFTYIFYKRFQLFRLEEDTVDFDSQDRMKPFYSLKELEEKAKSSTTIDEYYSVPKRIKSDPLYVEELTSTMSSMGDNETEIYEETMNERTGMEKKDYQDMNIGEKREKMVEIHSSNQDACNLNLEHIYEITDVFDMDSRLSALNKPIDAENLVEPNPYYSAHILETASSLEDGDLDLLIESRRMVSHNIDDFTILESFQENQKTFSSADEANEQQNEAFHDTGMDLKDLQSNLTKTHNKYSNEEINSIFEDLEELYLRNKRKKNE
ncbi:hypothetical protein [Bacillus sp. V5-8f]|uniref:hypothetical protein n=1 Tax=Bacillus sp. V5-8f TaxID=2053044 RepID=UPI000C78EE2C|nr:hypothetical protein [Bacillus sp. V5-8f]PLT32383.1 hypothetical protein CUU64_20020 [Bacillus sp. V5-8f]